MIKGLSLSFGHCFIDFWYRNICQPLLCYSSFANLVREVRWCRRYFNEGNWYAARPSFLNIWRAFMANHREQNTVCAFQLSSNLTLYYYVIMFLSKVLLEQFLHSNTFLFWPVLCVGQWARQKIISHYFAVLLLLCYCIKKNELKTRLAQQSILSMTRLIY